MRQYFVAHVLWVLMVMGCSLSDADLDQSGDSTDFPNAIAGIVVDSSGQPQQNASVYLVKSANWLQAQNDGASVVLDSTVTDSIGNYTLNSYTQETVAIEVALDSFAAQVSGIDPADAAIKHNQVTVAPKKWYRLTLTDTTYFGKSLAIYETRHSLSVSDSGTVEFYGVLPENVQFFAIPPHNAAFHRLSDSVIQVAVSHTPFAEVLDTTPDNGTENDTVEVKDSVDTGDSLEVTDPADTSDTTAVAVPDTVVTEFDSFNDGDWFGSIGGTRNFTWYIQLHSNTWYHPIDDNIGKNQTDVTIAQGFEGSGVSVKLDNTDYIIRGIISRFDDTLVDVSEFTHLRFYCKGETDITVRFYFGSADTPEMNESFMGVFQVSIGEKDEDDEDVWNEISLSLNDLQFKTSEGISVEPESSILELFTRLKNVSFSTNTIGNFNIDSIDWLAIDTE
ncbi:MAG: carboxypeptidase-like regulatory domain-containing protein [Fibrobacterales bacterium]